MRDTAAAKPSIAMLDKDAAGQLSAAAQDRAATPPASALDGPPKFAKSGNIAPADYFGDGKFYAVNTMQPPYQPSGNPPAAGDAERALRRPGHFDHAAAADRAHHRRSVERQARRAGPGTRAPGMPRSPTASSRGQGAAGDLRAGDSGGQPRFPTASSAVQLLRRVRSGDARRRGARRTSRITAIWSPISRRAACPRWRSTSRRAISISIRATPRSRTAMRTSPIWWRSCAPVRSGRTW